MSGFYYSAKTNGAYAFSEFDQFVGSGLWPDDAVEMTPEIFNEFFILLPPTGKMRAGGSDGFPAWIDIPSLTKEQLKQQAEQQKKWLVDEAMRSISVIQLKLQAGRTLTESESSRLGVVLDYIDAVTAIDAGSTEIQWPESPQL
ncbi:TPA: tail fiber assembly protein [Citrobacter braakii]|uniref:tail fiber assembly protein n=1 Tax=Atlantibacter hermannii TaxID=565 RepID=UPI00289A5583|nr:tail fiber assembly protein [Atlantibacter hermannii]HCB1742881.1 tail fiber assembly protein [Citrobacter braakii]